MCAVCQQLFARQVLKGWKLHFAPHGGVVSDSIDLNPVRLRLEAGVLVVPQQTFFMHQAKTPDPYRGMVTLSAHGFPFDHHGMEWQLVLSMLQWHSAKTAIQVHMTVHVYVGDVFAPPPDRFQRP